MEYNTLVIDKHRNTFKNIYFESCVLRMLRPRK